jgi:sugar/nucleoside kinase (ribokinase family)
MAVSDFDVVIPGNYFCDLIFTGFPKFPELGSEVYTEGLTITIGGALNTVIALHRLGVKVGWVGCIGTDLFSRYVLDRVEREGIDTSLIRHVDAPFQRVTAAISYPHDRAFITYVDEAQSAVSMALDVQDKISFRHLHFTGLQIDADIPALMAAVKARGISVSMDCQDRPFTLRSPGVSETISGLQVFMPSAKEAMQLAETDSLEQAGEQLSQMVPLLVIKDGANGAIAWRDNQRLTMPAIAVEAVDTTGAGDVFNAGFLCAHLENQSLTDCLRWGNICGGLSTQGYGGTSTAPSRDAVERMLA